MEFRQCRAEEELVKKGYRAEQFSVTKDISAGGLLFVSHEPIPVGSILELKIELFNKDEPIECLARVVRIEEEGSKYNIAACFLDITGSQRSMLNKYVAAQEG